MWKVEYTKRFLKELSELPKEIQAQAEGIVFGELLTTNPFLSKYSRIPPSSAGGMNGLPSPLGGEG